MNDLSPGIRDLVLALNAAGFNTVDSGDGSNHADGMCCALPYKHVFLASAPDRADDTLERLRLFMHEFGGAWEVWLDDGVEDDIELRFLGVLEAGWKAKADAVQ